jgi:hypothetical protein
VPGGELRELRLHVEGPDLLLEGEGAYCYGVLEEQDVRAAFL